MTAAAAEPVSRRSFPTWVRSGVLADCLTLLALAALPRMAVLDRWPPLIQDEFFSVYWSQLDLGFLTGEGARLETNPPGYFVLLHEWMKIAGATPWAIRLPSALFSASTVVVGYALGRVLAGRTTALLAGVLMAFSTMAIYYGREARTYALTGLLDGVALLALASYGRALFVDGRRRLGWLAVFMACAVASVCTHYSSAFFVAACFAAVGLHLVTTRPFPRQEALVWGAAGLAIAAAVAPLLLTGGSLSRSSNISWIEPLSRRSLALFFLDLLDYHGLPLTKQALIAAAVLLVLAAGLRAWVRSRPDRVEVGLLVLLPATFCVTLIGVSAVRPLLLARVGVWLALPLCLLLARAVTLQPTPTRRGAAGAAALAAFLFGTGTYYLNPGVESWSPGGEDWSQAGGFIASDARCDGPILYAGPYALGVFYYQPDLFDRPVYTIEWPDQDPGTAAAILARRVLRSGLLTPDEVASFAGAHPHTVVLVRWNVQSATPSGVKALLEHASTRGAFSGVSVACL
jgi:hypothetical protein